MKTVYFVDDDTDGLQFFKEISTDISRPHFFRSGAEMIAFADDSPPDLVVLDIRMPLEDGYEILAALRANPKYDNVPIVIHSVRCDEKCRARCFELGANYFVRKADRYESLATSIRHILSRNFPSPSKWDDFFYDHSN